MLHNHAWLEDPVQVQERPMDFDVAEYEKFFDRVSDSTLQQVFKNPLVEFQCNVEVEYLQ